MEIHHIALRTIRLDSVVAFYREILGLGVVKRVGDSVWLGLDHGVLMVERRRPYEPEVPKGSLELIAFRVTEEDRHEVRARLVERAVPVEAETEHSLYFRDPDGRRVGVSSHPLTDE